LLTLSLSSVFLEVEETRDLFRQVLFEVAKLAQAQGIGLTDEAAEKLYTYFLGRAESERNATSSMQRYPPYHPPTMCACVCARVRAHTHTHTLPYLSGKSAHHHQGHHARPAI
jgi:hypothetical protein